MNWKLKAFVQKTISMFPFSGKLNYFFQTRISKNLPVSDEVFAQKQVASRKHLAVLRAENNSWQQKRVYEFGGGYDLAIPILLNHAGVQQQVVTDINPLLKPSLVNNIFTRAGMEVKIASPSDLSLLGITYITLVNPAKTGFADNSFDFVHSTDTLEHIPAEQLLSILQECYRLLAPGGVISCIVDLQDHYAYSDANLSPFNFYTFSDREWEKFNNPLHYQNRLLAAEYYSLFARAGFAPIQMELTKAPEKALKQLQEMKLSARFSGKAIDELGNLRCHIWAEKPD